MLSTSSPIIHSFNSSLKALAKEVEAENFILSNALLLIKIVFKLVHPTNASSPIEHIFGGIIIDFMPVHPLKADECRVVIEGENITSDRLVQFSNADTPIVVNLDGNVIFSN